jgi:hypothetical protein
MIATERQTNPSVNRRARSTLVGKVQCGVGPKSHTLVVAFSGIMRAEVCCVIEIALLMLRTRFGWSWPVVAPRGP